MKAYRTFNFWYFVRKDLSRVAQYLALGIGGAFLAIYGFRLATTANPAIEVFPAFIVVAILAVICGLAYAIFAFTRATKIILKSGK